MRRNPPVDETTAEKDLADTTADTDLVPASASIEMIVLRAGSISRDVGHLKEATDPGETGHRTGLARQDLGDIGVNATDMSGAADTPERLKSIGILRSYSRLLLRNCWIIVLSPRELISGL